MMNLAIEITRACNYHCKYCGVNAGNSLKNELSTKEIFDLIEKTKPKHLHITGGEPLLRKDVFEIIDHGKKYGRVYLRTNGSLITKKVAEKINADGINISIDGLPGKNASLRDKNNFKQVLRVLNNLESAGRLSRVRICITVSKENLEEVDKVVRYFSPRIRKFGIGKLAPIGRAKKEMKASRLDALKVYMKLFPLQFKNHILFYAEFGGFFKIIFNELTVLSDGSIIPCCLVRKPIGNIRTIKRLPRFPMICPLFFSGCAECKRICSN